MDIIFNNVQIGISANNAKEAYAKLCKMLHVSGVEYQTDTYSIGDEERSTEELFPSDNEPSQPDDNTIVIEVSGGLVSEVYNVPSGYSYEIHDYDVEGAEEGELHEDKNGDEYFKYS